MEGVHTRSFTPYSSLTRLLLWVGALCEAPCPTIQWNLPPSSEEKIQGFPAEARTLFPLCAQVHRAGHGGRLGFLSGLKGCSHFLRWTCPREVPRKGSAVLQAPGKDSRSEQYPLCLQGGFPSKHTKRVSLKKNGPVTWE